MTTTDIIIDKCRAGEPISWAEYCQGASATLSNQWHAKDQAGAPALCFRRTMGALRTLIAAGHTTDQIKKALFYGRNVAEVDRTLVALEGIEPPDAPPPADWPTQAEAGGGGGGGGVSHTMIHCILGIATEAIELVEALVGALESDKPLDMVNIHEELGDLLWYMHIAFANQPGAPDLGPILRKNLLKLAARYPNKFEAARANNRDLIKERSILEIPI